MKTTLIEVEMLDEMPVSENQKKPTKLQSLVGLTVMTGLAGLFLFFLYQALSNQIKF
ncbi:MAG TPA: hypothetical protein VMV05_11295 [bacterium]|nr:hypothetical protein [bacterium]